MDIALINEGTYPFVHGGVSVWCDQLVRGLAEHRYHLTTLTPIGNERPVWDLPPNVASLTNHPLWGPAPRPTPSRGRARRQLADAYTLMLEGAVSGRNDKVGDFASALQELVPFARDGRLTTALQSDQAVSWLLGVWKRWAGVDAPPLTVRDALEVTNLFEHALRTLAYRHPRVDVVHAVANGLPTLMGLVTKWEQGAPLVMAEHGVYLRERYLSLCESPFNVAVRTALLRFFRQLTTLGYRSADLITPCTEFNRRWELQAGADPSRIVVLHNGVDPSLYPAIRHEPDRPTLVWVGRIDPLKDLETLLRGFAFTRALTPGARLKLFGPVPKGNEAYAARCKALAVELGLGGSVGWEGPVRRSTTAFEQGHVVVLSSVSEGLPYSVLEAMMCGRPNVATDVGGVAEAIGTTGIVVPPHSPEALGRACARLLMNRDERLACGVASRERALQLFTLDRLLGTMRILYGEAVHRSRSHWAPQEQLIAS